MSSNKSKTDLLQLLHISTEQDRTDLDAELIQLQLLEKVSSIMEDRGMTRSELANKLGISRAFVSQMFAADRALNLKLLAKIQRILDVHFEVTPIQSWSYSPKMNQNSHPSKEKLVNVWFNKSSHSMWDESDNEVLSA